MESNPPDRGDVRPAVLHGERLTHPRRRMADALADFAADHPEVVLSEVTASGSTDRITVAEMERRARRIASALADVHDDGPAIVVTNSAIDNAVGRWACMSAGIDHGFWSIPPNRFEEDLDGLRIFQRTIGATTLLVSDEDDGATFGAATGASAHDLRSLLAAAAHDPPPLACDRRDQSVYMATSGSGSGFRVVRRDLDEPTRRPDRRSKRSLLLFELSTITGGWGTLARLGGGLHYVSPTHVLEHPETLIDVIEREGIQTVTVPPTALPILAHLIRTSNDRDLRSLERISVGSELIIHAAVSALAASLRIAGCTQVELSIGYGMTEIGLISSSILGAQAFDTLDPRRPVPLGGPVPGRSLRIVDDAGRQLPVGEIGQVEVRTEDELFLEYVGDPDATDAAYTDDGWFRTGDLGYVEGDDVVLIGRRTGGPTEEMIRRRTLELELRAVPGVADGQLWLEPTGHRRYSVYYLAEPSLGPTGLVDLHYALTARVQRELDLVDDIRRISTEQVPLTRSGKVHRPSLVQVSGRAPDHGPVSTHPDDIRRDVESAWKRSLGLEVVQFRLRTYAEFGGDSLGLLGLVAAIEETYGVELPLGQFLERPTVEGLVGATTAAVLAPSQRHESTSAPLFVEALLNTWPGRAVDHGPHLRVANEGGANRPLVWIFNWDFEFGQMAQALGEDQPLFASRSFVALPGISYRPETVADMADRLADELRSIGVAARAPVIGGNCQAAVLVLALAHRLEQEGAPPGHVVVLDAMPGPDAPTHAPSEEVVTVLCGSDNVHGIDTDAANVHQLSANHGTYFFEPGLSELASVLRSVLSPDPDPA